MPISDHIFDKAKFEFHCADTAQRGVHEVFVRKGKGPASCGICHKPYGDGAERCNFTAARVLFSPEAAGADACLRPHWQQ